MVQNGTQSSPPETLASTLDSHLSPWWEISIAREGCHAKMAYNHDKKCFEETFGLVQKSLVSWFAVERLSVNVKTLGVECFPTVT